MSADQNNRRSGARHCRTCDGVFLPGTENVLVPVQCPHCSAITLLGECRLASVDVPLEQEWTGRSEEQEKAAASDALHQVQARRLYIAAGLAVLLAAGGFLYMRSHTDATARDERTESLTRDELAAQQDLVESDAVLKKVLSAPDWEQALPMVCQRERVATSMGNYYRRAQWSPLQIERITDHVRGRNAAGETLECRIHLADGNVRNVLMQREAGEWRLDWEIWAAPNQAYWMELLESRPGNSAELRLMVSLKPAADASILEAGGTPDTHIALTVWNLDRRFTATAVLARTSVLYQRLHGISFQHAVKIIAVVTMVKPSSQEPIVSLDRIRQRGWLWGYEATDDAAAATPADQ